MQHKDVGLGDIHQIHNYEFDTIVERDAFIPDLENLKLICLVNSPFSYYALKSIEPIEWKPLSTVTINLEDFSVLSAEETLKLVSAKQNIYDITNSEYKCGYLRGGKEVFGIEVDCGALPNNTVKTITIPNYLATNKYWVDQKNSIAYDPTNKVMITLPYASSSSLSSTISAYVQNDKIYIYTGTNRTSYTETKVVLNYTKG
jgi:hypothetical protein